MVASLLKRLFRIKELPRKLSYEEARAVLESHQDTLEQELAARPDAEPEMLYYLAARRSRPIPLHPRLPTGFSPTTSIRKSAPSSPARSAASFRIFSNPSASMFAS